MRRPTTDFVLIALFTVVTAATACGGDPAVPVAVPTAKISIASPSTDVNVGASITLSATAFNDAGQPLAGKLVQWVSANPAVATISGNGTTGFVTGVAPGTALVSAASEGKTASATITVHALPDCAERDVLSMSVGDVIPLTPAQRLTLCLGGSGPETEYVLVVANSGIATDVKIAPVNTARVESPVAVHDLAAHKGAVPNFESARPFRSDVVGFAPATEAQAQADHERLSFAPIARASTLVAGDTVSFNVNLADNSCTGPVTMHAARVLKVLPHVIVYRDLQFGSHALTDDDLAGLAALFDTTIYALDTLNFGAHFDANGDGRVSVLFTAGASDAGYIGVVSHRDFIGAGACPAGNNEDLIYLGDYGTDQAEYLGFMPYVIAHEFAHVITAAGNANAWWTEPLAFAASELLFYKLTGIVPRSNVSAKILNPSQRAELVTFTPVISMYLSYLRVTESNSPIPGFSSREANGAGWNYLRFVADRYADDATVNWKNMTSVADFTRPTQRDTTMLLDWAVSNVMDDVVPAVPARYQNLSWNTRSMLTVTTPYPLVTRDLVGEPVTIPLVSGGTSYLQFRVEAGKVAFIRSTSNGAATPARMALIRTR